ncbi:MAG: hypothetical protein Kow0089_09710 [Desulfobulbaceae bacterium]
MSATEKYQNNLSVHSPVLLDSEYKRPKVDKMLAVLKDCGVLEQHNGTAVDIGCSAGFFTQALAQHFKVVFGIDIDRNALPIAVSKSSAPNLMYILADSLKLPFEDNSVDLVICNHVYEHVPDAELLFVEIERVLSDTGICYLGAASRFIVKEPHYHLPFLSWLPRVLAHRYMKLTGRGDQYYEQLRSYWGIKNLISRFRVTDYTIKIIAQPDKYCARDMIPHDSWIEKVPVSFWRMLYAFFPSYIFILQKRGHSWTEGGWHDTFQE